MRRGCRSIPLVALRSGCPGSRKCPWICQCSVVTRRPKQLVELGFVEGFKTLGDPPASPKEPPGDLAEKGTFRRKTTKIQPQRLRIRPRAAVESPCRLPRSECMASDIKSLKTILCCYDSYVHWPGGPENMFLPLLLPVANYQRSILSSSRAPNNENGP